MPTPPRRAPSEHGFTMVELTIVILVLAILASMAIPQFKGVNDEAAQGQVVNHLRTLVDGAVRYKLKNGEDPPDTSSGSWHPSLAGFIDQISFEKQTPINGVWDIEDDFGVSSAIGVHFLTGAGTGKNDAYMEVIDGMIDDGDLAAGAFRKLGTARYYFVLTP